MREAIRKSYHLIKQANKFCLILVSCVSLPVAENLCITKKIADFYDLKHFAFREENSLLRNSTILYEISFNVPFEIELLFGIWVAVSHCGKEIVKV